MASHLLSIDHLRYWALENHRRWLSALIIIGTLLISAALAFKAPQRLLLLIPALIFGSVVVLVFIRWPPLGLIAIIGSIIIPVDGPSGVNVTMGLVALLLALWALKMIARQGAIRLASPWVMWPLLALVVVAIAAFGVGQLPWYTFAQPAPLGAQLGGLALYIFSAGAFLLAAHQVNEIRWLRWMTWFFLTLGAIYIAGRLIPGLQHFTSYLFTGSSTGSLFWVWLVALAFSQAAFNRKLHLGWRLALFCLTTATLYVAMAQSWAWNSGWLPALVALGAVVWIAWPRLGLLFALLGGVGLVVKLQPLISAIMVGDNEYSLSTRLEAWDIVWRIAKINPILGLGPANYRWYTPLFPIRGYALQFNSHSQYVDLVAQTGILGLICFLWLFGTVAWLGWQFRNLMSGTGFSRAYVYGALGGLVGTLVAAAFGDWVIPFFYNISMRGFRASILGWLFLGGLVALEKIHQTQLDKSEIP